jgi:uncharacterized protein (TIGR02246 family)
MSNRQLADADEIRSLLDGWMEAAQAKDVERLMSFHAPDVLLFDVVDPLRYAGVDSVRKRTTEWFSTFQGPIAYKLHDVSIATEGGVAFCHSLNHVKGTQKDGTTLDMWWRATLCFGRHNGKWVVTHAHNSVPSDVTSGKASLGLKP